MELSEKKREKNKEVCDNVTENFAKLMSDSILQLQEYQRTLSRINLKKKKQKLHLAISFSNYRKVKIKL